MAKFTHLHVHTQYSLLDGLAKIPDLVDYVKEQGMDSVAITDHGVLYGAVEFFKKAKEKGVKPIIGVELYVAHEGMTQRRPGIDDTRYHIILLAKNAEGYRNLVKLLTKAHLEGYYYKPRIDQELLQQHASGLIALSACLQGQIPRLILANKLKDAEELALKYQQLFGKDSFYLEVQRHEHIPEQAKVNEALKKMAAKLDIPLVATNDIHYLRKEDADAQDVLMLINTGADPNDPERLSMKADDFSLASPEEMEKYFADFPDAISNTQKIAELCNFEFELGKVKLPQFAVPDGKTPEQFLDELANAGVKKRFGETPDPKVRERLAYEMAAVKQMGFISYFLIVQDFVNWAKQNRIVVGPGRGSVGGSLLAYCLGITNIDPLKYNLLFERFLNPGRTSDLPDIDMDFTDIRRDEVIKYVADKYGRNHVAQIITFGTMAARAVIRDVGRALSYDYSYCDKVAKMIPFGLNLSETLEKIDEFKELYRDDPKAQQLIDFAKKLEGVARHASTHACGVVISADPLEELIPLQHPTQGDETIVTQYEMHSIEDLGLLKMDFLGLKNLTIIEDTLKRIYKVHDISVDLDNLPLDDKEVFKLLQRGDTIGIFQLESAGIQRYLKQMKPSEFEDIIAIVALYRPGPMEFIPDFIAGKLKKKKVEYMHPKLEPILKSTYGICIAKDSFIQLANQGGITRIDELVSSPKEFSVQSLEDNRFVEKSVVSRFDNGKKEVYEITLRTGKRIKATKDHQFLTPDGWKTLQELKKGQFLATPKKLFTGKKTFDKHRIKILAYLIADGSLTSGTSCYFVNKDNTLLNDYKECAEVAFSNLKIIFTTHIRGVKRACPTKVDRSGQLYHQPNGLLAWLRELELKSKVDGKNSSEKFIPSFIFELKPDLIAAFLAALWDCDGGIAPKRAYYTTISEKLAIGLQTLLLKLGINNYLYRTGEYLGRKGKKTKTYRIVIYDLANFQEAIGKLMLTGKKEALRKAINEAKKSHEVLCKEFVPRNIFYQKLIEFQEKNNLSQRQISGLLKMGRKGFFGKKEREKNRLNLEVAKKISALVKDRQLREMCNKKQIRWEDILSITYAGKEPVYDLEIGQTHNFIANNILVHNCVYQEQLMMIARELAGFSLSDADVLRKAVGKKIEALLMTQKEKLISGMIKNNISKEIANKLWEWVLPFARYGFNKSHSTAYALIAYQTAWLKTHYPVEFMAALLTSEKADVERIGFLIDECKKMNVEVLAPDINESFRNFSVVPNAHKIRFGLAAIKNVGENIVETIVEERKTNGHYASIENFLERVVSRDINKKSMESLIKAGAFDKLEERNKLLQNLEKLLEWSRDRNKNKNNRQKGLFDGSSSFKAASLSLEEAPPASKKDKLDWEKDLLGLYVSSHPLDDFKKILEKKAIPLIRIDAALTGKLVRIGGVISSMKKIITKSGKPMLFVGLEDQTSKIEVIAFPRVIERYPASFQLNKVVLVLGKIDNRDGMPKMICDQIEEIVEG